MWCNRYCGDIEKVDYVLMLCYVMLFYVVKQVLCRHREVGLCIYVMLCNVISCGITGTVTPREGGLRCYVI